MNRRDFLKSAAAATSVALAPSLLAQSQPAESKRFILSAPLTHSDWILKPGIDWNIDGVHHMLDACKACGWSRIYWRALDGGRAMYKSKILAPADNYDHDSFWSPQTPEDKKLVDSFTANLTPDKRKELVDKLMKIDYANFDPLAEAVKYGHSIGLQIHAWVTINEDDHGWGLVSTLAQQHPEWRWVKRDGRIYHSQMSFAFEGVRKFKLQILQELLDNYPVDGFFIDWIRTGDIRDNPQTDSNGVADSGYEPPNIQAFKTQFNVDPHDVPNDDPRWVKLRAEPQTVFMRDARKLLKNKPLAIMVGHPWHYRGLNNPISGNLKGLLLDVPTWANEGLVDSAVAAGYYLPGGNPEAAYNALKQETAGKVDVWTYAWVPTSVADLDRDLAVAEKVGAKQVLFWEADYIDDRPNRTELQAAMSSRATS